ncbi:MAG: porin [Holosporaceae bacterium]|jgi:predicted porin|nr:porin [Holosporaceae bacterium]
MQKYGLVFLLFFLSFETNGAAKDFELRGEYDDDFPLNEAINDKLTELGPDGRFSLCGRSHFAAVFIDARNKNSDFDDAAVSMQGDLCMKYLGRTDSCGYGFEAGVKIRSGLIKRGEPVLKTVFLFIEADKVGIVKLGYINTASDMFSLYGDKFSVGFYGAGSRNLGAFYEKSSGSIIDTGFSGDDVRAAKIVWISPVVGGFSVGLSFTPDGRDEGLFQTRRGSYSDFCGKTDFGDACGIFSKNVITGGGAFEFGDPDGFNVRISAAAWFGKGKSAFDDDAKVRNVRAFNIGAALCGESWKISVGYTDGGKSLLPRNRLAGDAGKVYSAGLSGLFRKLEISVGYFYSVVKFSRREKSKAEIISAAAEYEFNKNLRVYFEYDNLRTDACGSALEYASVCRLLGVGKNRANVFIIGSKITF